MLKLFLLTLTQEVIVYLTYPCGSESLIACWWMRMILELLLANIFYRQVLLILKALALSNHSEFARMSER